MGINEILEKGISVISREIDMLYAKPVLDKVDQDKLTEYLKTLVIISKDFRIAKKEDSTDVKTMTDEEIKAAILKEAEKILDDK